MNMAMLQVKHGGKLMSSEFFMKQRYYTMTSLVLGFVCPGIESLQCLVCNQSLLVVSS